MLTSRFILGLLLLISILYVSPTLAIHANDASSMTALLQNTAGWPADWRLDNLTQLCSWTGMTCNGAGRLTEINMDPKNLDFWVNGTLPEQFFGLDALQSLILPRTSLLGGTLPTAIFNMSSLTSFGVRGSAQKVILPDTISPLLTEIRLSGTNISGTIPSTWNGDNLVHFTLDNTQLQCPLPDWLITKFRDGSIPVCSMIGNFISVTDGKFCGQIPVNETKCRILPTMNPLEKAPASKTDATHSFGNHNVWVELSRNIIYMYGVSNKTGLPSRREYVYIQFQGWTIYDDQHVYDVPFGVGWDSSIKYDQVLDTYICDLIMSNGMRMTFSFHFSHPLAPRGLKFGFEILRDNTLSDANQPLRWPAGQNTKFSLATAWYLRQPHSINEPFGCDIGSPSFNGIPRCNSDIYQLSGFLGYDSNACLVYAADALSDNTTINFSYPFCYIGDNVPDVVPRGAFDVHCSGVGSAQLMGRVKKISPDVSQIPFIRQDSSMQFSAMVGSFNFAPFNHSLVYDPDVRISLLFEPGDLADESPAAIAERATAIAVGVGVGVPLAVLFAAGAIAVFASPKLRHAIFPFTRPADAAPKPDLLLEDNNQSPPPARESGWSASKPNARKLTNVH